jgi:hypothetical protein
MMVKLGDRNGVFSGMQTQGLKIVSGDTEWVRPHPPYEREEKIGGLYDKSLGGKMVFERL